MRAWFGREQAEVRAAAFVALGQASGSPCVAGRARADEAMSVVAAIPGGLYTLGDWLPTYDAIPALRAIITGGHAGRAVPGLGQLVAWLRKQKVYALPRYAECKAALDDDAQLSSAYESAEVPEERLGAVHAAIEFCPVAGCRTVSAVRCDCRGSRRVDSELDGCAAIVGSSRHGGHDDRVHADRGDARSQ